MIQLGQTQGRSTEELNGYVRLKSSKYIGLISLQSIRIIKIFYAIMLDTDIENYALLSIF